MRDKPPLPQLTLVLGGAASGKSAFAEELLAELGRPLTYLATAQAGDSEMAARIAAHQARRAPDAGGEARWTTIEAPLDAGAALATVPPGGAVLFDCATMWLMNQTEAGRDLAQARDDLLSALADTASPVVIVSNELGMGLVPEQALSRRFRQDQGNLNQALAARAGLVVFVAAGLPMVLKGALPARHPRP